MQRAYIQFPGWERTAIAFVSLTAKIGDEFVSPNNEWHKGTIVALGTENNSAKPKEN